MPDYLPVSEIARRYGVPPRLISDWFYSRRLDDAAAPVIAGRRLVPVTYLPTIEAQLELAGLLRKEEAHA